MCFQVVTGDEDFVTQTTVVKLLPTLYMSKVGDQIVCKSSPGHRSESVLSSILPGVTGKPPHTRNPCVEVSEPGVSAAPAGPWRTGKSP